MAMLFRIEDRYVHPNPETLLVHPFSEIWERDEDPKKRNALEEFAYIEFISSEKKSNPFRGYTEKMREEKVKKEVITQEDWKPDELVLEAIRRVKEFQMEASETYRLYISAKRAVEKLEDFLSTFSLNTVNAKTGNPLYKPKDITSALKDIQEVSQKLEVLKKKIDEEVFEGVRNRAQKEISPFADPDSID